MTTGNDFSIRPYIRGIRALCWRIGNDFAPDIFRNRAIFLSSFVVWNQRVSLSEFSTERFPSVATAQSFAENYIKAALSETPCHERQPVEMHSGFSDFRDEVIQLAQQLVSGRFDGLKPDKDHWYDGTALETIFTIYLNNLRIDESYRATNHAHGIKRVQEYIAFYWDDTAENCPIRESEFEG